MIKFKSMNINEFYGDISMPSQIADSFQAEYNPNHIHTQQSNQNQDYSLPHQDTNLDSSIQDTFLDKIVIPTKDTKPKDSHIAPAIQINKTQIVRYALPKQQLKQTVQITNCSARPTFIKIQSHFPISHSSIPSNEIDGQSETFLLKGWEKIEVTYVLKQGEDEFGDIFETVFCQAKFRDQKQLGSKKNYRIQVTVHYIIPKLKMKYEGCSDVMPVYGNKVAICEICANKWGQYQLQLAVEQVQRLECQIQVRGELDIFPKQLVFYKGEFRKLNIRKQKGEKDRKSAIILRAQDGSTSFVFAVKIV